MYKVSYPTKRVEQVDEFKTEGQIHYYRLNGEACLDHTMNPLVNYFPSMEEAKQDLIRYYKDQAAKALKTYASLVS